MEEIMEQEKAKMVKCRIQTFCVLLFLFFIGYGTYEYFYDKSYT